jgi:selenide,water dikinase
MDCSIRATAYPDMFLVSTVDFFYPLVEDPYVQGRIACANVLSDMYAMGISDVDNILMTLACSRDMASEHRKIVTKLMMKGFNDLAREAGTIVTGGQTIFNPWPIIGGAAMSVRKQSDIINPVNAEIGNLLILTKPLGTQVAVNLHQWFLLQNENWDNAKTIVDENSMKLAYRKSVDSMQRLNRTSARLMHKYNARAATDVTGFGILGHANNLAENQKASVRFRIHTLPVIRDMLAVSDSMNMFNLRIGRSAETSGGMLIVIDERWAKQFIDEIETIDGQPAWIVGCVEQGDGNNRAEIVDPRIVEV